MKTKKEVSASDVGEDAAKGNERQLLLPHNGNLWMPGTKPFSDSALESLDLRRAMSIMPQ